MYLHSSNYSVGGLRNSRIPPTTTRFDAFLVRHHRPGIKIDNLYLIFWRAEFNKFYCTSIIIRSWWWTMWMIIIIWEPHKMFAKRIPPFDFSQQSYMRGWSIMIRTHLGVRRVQIACHTEHLITKWKASPGGCHIALTSSPCRSSLGLTGVGSSVWFVLLDGWHGCS